jgi:hypothetical protein
MLAGMGCVRMLERRPRRLTVIHRAVPLVPSSWPLSESALSESALSESVPSRSVLSLSVLSKSVLSLLAFGLLMLAGCASGSRGTATGNKGVATNASSTVGDEPTRSPTPSAGSQSPAVPLVVACTTMPSSAGPAVSVAQVGLTAPGTAAPGSVLEVRTQLSVASAGTRIIASPAESALLVLQDGRVVARQAGDPRGAAIPLPLRAGATLPAQAVPTRISLVGCSSAAGRAPGAALAPGRYDVVAVMGYRMDSLNNAADGSAAVAPPGISGRAFHLVSAAVPLTIG